MNFRLGAKCASFAALCLLAAAKPAAADTITLMWDANASPIGGYAVYIGTTSGTYSQRIDVGGATTYTFPSATTGQRYCFAVSAYLLISLLEGPKSSEVCGYSNAPPVLVNPGSQTSTVGQPTSLQLQGSDPASQPLTYSATGLPPGLTIMASTGYIAGTGTTAGTYSVTARASDGVLSDSRTFTWTMTASAADTTPPTVTITAPTSAATYSTAAATVALSGTAADNKAVTQVTWVNDRGGNGTASGTTSWSVGSVALVTGANVITIQARDAAGNQTNDVLTVTRSGGGDTTAPTVSITGPTSATTYSTTATSLTLSGTAADSVGVTQVSWVNNRGGSGTATGTTSWSGSVGLQNGSNVLTVTARDAAGNTATDVLTVTSSAAASPLSVVSITANKTAPQPAGSTIVITANAAGGTAPYQYKWTLYNGTTWNMVQNWTTSPSITWTPTTANSAYRWALWVRNATTTADTPDATGFISFAIGTAAPVDTTAPAISITGPTSATTYTTSSATLALSGTASDSVGVTQVTWANNRGGSGTASGTTSWSIGPVALLSGSNVVTVTARDAAGNQSSDALTVTYNAPVVDTTPPTVSITGPTSAATYSTTSSSLAINGSASDSVGVTQVGWSNNRGGSGAATGTTSWSASGIPLLSGTNVITVIARDAAGNTSSDVLTVTSTVPSGPLTVVSITANKVAPQRAGTTVVITANLSGGTGPYQYKWTLYNGSSWNMVQNWTTSPSITWTPTSANSGYQWALWVRSAGNTADSPEATGFISFPIN